MALNTDGGQKLMCPKCRGVIKHKEQCGIVDDGYNLWHTDCWRDRFGDDTAHDAKWARDELVQRWLHFDKLPPNLYGARRVA